jgi:hypothetical protein
MKSRICLRLFRIKENKFETISYPPNFTYLLQKIMHYKKIFHYTAILSCIALIITCFIPWVHYNSIDATFTGYNVKQFSTGVYYGKAGVIITGIAVVSLCCTLAPYIVVKRVNMFLCAFLVAYCMRTYIVFTGSLFDGEVVKLAGIYLIVLLSVVMVVCSVFPYLKKEENFEG